METSEKLGTVGQIISKLIFGALFFIIFGILVVAIVYALLTRAIMLWMFAMFSPLFALSFVLGHGKGIAEKISKYSIGHFISLAMVPVYVSAALAFGLMFLGLAMNGSGGNSTTQKTPGEVSSDNVKIDNTTPGTTSFTF